MFVSGGSRGIGAGIVLGAAQAGYDVAFTYRARADAAQEVLRAAAQLAPESRIKAYQLDVGSSAAVDQVGDAVEEELGDVSVVVSNAGLSHASLAVALEDDDWEKVITANLTGAFYVARRFLSGMMVRRYGRLIFVSSIAAHGMSGDVAYCASKAGILGLSAALAKEYGRRGVTSNALLLGFFDTDMTRDAITAAKRQTFVENCPVGRTGDVSEVAAAVLYLAGQSASYINGQELGITGGLGWSN